MSIDFFIPANGELLYKERLGIDVVSLDLFETLADLDKQKFENLLNERLPKEKLWVRQLLSGEHGKSTIYNAIRLILFGPDLTYTNSIRRFVGDKFLTGRYNIEEVLDLSVLWVKELSKYLSTHKMEEAKSVIYLPQRDSSGQFLPEDELKTHYGYIVNTASDYAKKFDNPMIGSDDREYLGIMLRTLKECMTLNQEALGFVKELKNRGIKIGIISDTASCYIDIVDKLEMGLGFTFDAHVYSCDTGRKKFLVKNNQVGIVKKNKARLPDERINKQNNYVTLASALFGIPEDRLTYGDMQRYLNFGNEYIEDTLTLKRIKANGILYTTEDKLKALITTYGKNILNVPMATFSGVRFEGNKIYMNAPQYV